MADVEVFEIDDDFDPLEDMGMDAPDDDEARPDTDYQTPIPDADKSIVPEKRELPARERIEKLLAGMPGQGPRLLEAIGLAREETCADELSAALDEAFPRDASVYSSLQVIRLLEEAGALAVRVEEAQAPLEGAPEEVRCETDDAPSAAAREDAAREAADSACDVSPAVAAQDAACRADRACESASEQCVAASGEGEAYRMAAPEPVCFYTATPDGLAVLEQRGGVEAVRAMLLEEPRYLPIFKDILVRASAEGGVSMKVLDAAVSTDPLCADPRRFCGYFLGKLERLGAVRFEGTWVSTPLGDQVLASDAFAE